MTEYIVLIADGVPDNTGEVMLIDGMGWPNDGVPIRFGVGGPEIGRASLRLRGNEVVARFDLDPRIMPPRLFASDLAGLVPAVSGTARRNDDGVCTNVDIQFIELCERNADSRIPPLPPPDRPQGNQ